MQREKYLNRMDIAVTKFKATSCQSTSTITVPSAFLGLVGLPACLDRTSLENNFTQSSAYLKMNGTTCLDRIFDNMITQDDARTQMGLLDILNKMFTICDQVEHFSNETDSDALNLIDAILSYNNTQIFKTAGCTHPTRDNNWCYNKTAIGAEKALVDKKVSDLYSTTIQQQIFKKAEEQAGSTIALEMIFNIILIDDDIEMLCQAAPPMSNSTITTKSSR
jgi:hypothetical protein